MGDELRDLLIFNASMASVTPERRRQAAQEKEMGASRRVWRGFVDTLPHFPPDEKSPLGKAWSAVKEFATPSFPPEKGSVLNPDKAAEEQRAAEEKAALAAQGFSPAAARWNRLVQKAPLLEIAGSLAMNAYGSHIGFAEAMAAGGFQRAAAMTEWAVTAAKGGAVGRPLIGPLKAFESALKDQLMLRPGEEPSDLPKLLAPSFPPEPGSPADKAWQSLKASIDNLLQVHKSAGTGDSSTESL